MSWTDKEIDDLFREGANTQSFEYDSAYFSEIEAALPVNRKGRDFLWLGTALMFVAVLTTGYLINSDDAAFGGSNNQLAEAEVNEAEAMSSAQNKANYTNGTEASNNTESGQASHLTGNEVAATPEENITASIKVGEKQDVQAAHSTAIPASSMYDVATRNIRNKKGTNLANTIAAEPNETEVKALPVPTTTPVTNRNTLVAPEKMAGLEKAPISASLGLKSVNQLDNELALGLAPNALPMLTEIRPKAAFYLELNGGASQSLITPSAYTSTSFGGGVGVETYLGNFNLTTGLNLAISNHKDLTLTTEGKNYSFGSTLRTHHYSYDQVYNLDVPINLGYNFGNHNVNLGLRTSVLLGAKVQHTVYDNEEMVRSEKLFGLAGGLERFGMRPTIGYAYRMKNWTVGANVGVQLLQSVNEEYINGFNNRFPIDGQIYLRRSIKLRR